MGWTFRDSLGYDRIGEFDVVVPVGGGAASSAGVISQPMPQPIHGSPSMGILLLP